VPPEVDVDLGQRAVPIKKIDRPEAMAREVSGRVALELIEWVVFEFAAHEVIVRAEQEDRGYELDRCPVARDKWADVIGEGEPYTGSPPVETDIDDFVGIVLAVGSDDELQAFSRVSCIADERGAIHFHNARLGKMIVNLDPWPTPLCTTSSPWCF